MTDNTTTPSSTVSAAGLRLPPPPPPSPDLPPQSLASSATVARRDFTQADLESLLADLRELQAYCRSNKIDEAMILIDECIDRGVDTIGHIISVLQPLGYGRGQIGSMLTKGKRPYWKANSEGRYAKTEHHPLVAAAGAVLATSFNDDQLQPE